MQNKYLLRLVFLSWMNGCISQHIQTIDSCTCRTTNGSFYSLWPFGKTGRPYFMNIPGKFKWMFAYNPCTSMTFGQDDPHAKKICYDIGICKYPEVDRSRKYLQVGVQKGVTCELNTEGQIELVYETNESSIRTSHSKIQLICNETAGSPSFELKSDNNYIFTITTKCACPDQCWPPEPKKTTTTTPEPETTAPEPETTTPTSVVPGPTTVIPTTTSNSTKRSPKDSKLFYWELNILLPSLVGFVFVIMCCCLSWHITAVREALRYRCCHCCGEYQEPCTDNIYSNPLGNTEKTKLIQNKPKDKAVEHEDFEGKYKLVEPVQEEDVADRTQIVGKENVLSLVL